MDDEVFRVKVNKLYDTIFRVSMTYLKNFYDAEDVTEETFITYYSNAPDFENEELEKAWLIKVAINKCKNLRRCFWKNRRDDNFDFTTLKVYDNEDESFLGKIISELPDKYRTLILLYYYEEYSIREISGIMGINESTCQTRLERARHRIKEKINCKGEVSLCLKEDIKV